MIFISLSLTHKSLLQQLLAQLGHRHPLVDVLEGVPVLGLLQVAVGQLAVAGVPGALAQGQLPVVLRRGHLLAGHWELVAPAARARPREQLAGRVAGIDDGLTGFLFQVAVGTIVDHLQVGGLALGDAVQGGLAPESLGVGSICPGAVAAGDSTGSRLVAEGSEVVDMV